MKNAPRYRLVPLEIPSQVNGYATHVDESGFSVGVVYGDSNIPGQVRAARWNREGHRKDLGVSHGFTMAYGQNNRGIVVGSFSKGASGSARAVMWDAGGEMTMLAPLGVAGLGEEAVSINDDGLIAGRALIQSGESHSCRRRFNIDPPC